MTKPATVDLTKAAPAVSLAKHGVTSGLIKVNLNWTSPQTAAQRAAGEARGLFGRLRASLRSAAARTVDPEVTLPPGTPGTRPGKRPRAYPVIASAAVFAKVMHPQVDIAATC
ncbi:hypothetical protein ACFV2S_07595 [Streptomyces sp. NPDC059695]|uniref:hypothetical protein n=1 Tax=Streptomyces sp. NPDC059695 TaxID=3346910 RepID=UPI0036A5F620